MVERAQPQDVGSARVAAHSNGPSAQASSLMTETSTSQRLSTLIQFGWAVAELRGRYRQQLIALPCPSVPRPTRTEHTLPLNMERSSGELIHQVEYEVSQLADTLSVNINRMELPYQSQATPQPDKTPDTVMDAITQLYAEGNTAEADKKSAIWNHLANVFYGWDTKIQDTLAGTSSQEVASYQLGRGLAELYWSLHPDAPNDDVRSWSQLFAVERRHTIVRFLVRLTPLFDVLTTSSIAASLNAWGAVAEDSTMRAQSGTLQKLGEQVSIWRALLVDRVEPRTFVSFHPNVRLSHTGTTREILRTFWPELAIAGSAIVVTLCIVLLLTAFKTSSIAPAMVAVFGFFGITGAGFLARAKDAATSTIANIRLTVDATMVAAAVTVPPATINTLKGEVKAGTR